MMFIKVTLKNSSKNEAYINVAHIEGFRSYGEHSKIWLSDRDIIAVEEPVSEILKQIEEVRK